MCVCVCVCQLLSHVRLFATPQTVAHQAPLSMGFSRQKQWRALPFPSPKGTIERKKVKLLVSDSLSSHGLQPTRLLHPWNFPSRSFGVGCHFLLQDLNNTIDQIDRRHVQNISPSCDRIYILFKYIWNIFQVDHMLSYKRNVNKFKREKLHQPCCCYCG